MNLIVTVLVEKEADIKPGMSAGGQFFSTSSGLPAATEGTPWSKQQLRITLDALQLWHAQMPVAASQAHRSQRDQALSLASQGQHQFVFYFNTGDEIDLECLLEDTAELYARLSSASASSGLIVSQFTSV